MLTASTTPRHIARHVPSQILVCARVKFVWPSQTHLHQSARHVPRLSGFDSGIDQTFSPSHGVKEKLGGCETGEEEGNSRC